MHKKATVSAVAFLCVRRNSSALYNNLLTAPCVPESDFVIRSRMADAELQMRKECMERGKRRGTRAGRTVYCETETETPLLENSTFPFRVRKTETPACRSVSIFPCSSGFLSEQVIMP